VIGLNNKMSTKIYIDWQANDVLWNEEIREWENVYYIIYDLGGVRDPKRILTFSKTLLKCLQMYENNHQSPQILGNPESVYPQA